MANIGLRIYDKPRKWIKECRENSVSWEEIELARKNDFAGLQKFLELQADINFWPAMSI